MLDRHQKDVAAISARVQSLYSVRESYRINHGSTNSTRRSVLQQQATIDISHLKYIINVDVKSKIALVEPNVPMDRLVDTTLKYGLIPPVVMEFPGITVGGGYAGTSGESSSFKHGFFDRSIKSVEMILANGEVVKASDSERSDLFQGAAGACGTLGITTLIELRLVEATNFVETTYHPVNGMPAAVQKTQEFIQRRDDFDYLDGIMYSPTQGAVITGRLTNVRKNDRSPRFSRPRDPWYYLHVQQAISCSDGPVTEYISLEEYLFRYDRGGFWVGALAFKYFYTPFNRLTRWFLDDFLRTRMMYVALHASKHAMPNFVQDLALPMSKASEFVRYTDETFNIYPLWLCPLRQSPKTIFHPHTPVIDEPMLNVGLWGAASGDFEHFVKMNRDLESNLTKLGGMKWLYAQCFYTEKEFWSLYNREWYDQLRVKYSAISLPSVYDKTKIDAAAEIRAVRSSWWLSFMAIWPFAGFWSLWESIASGQYHLANKSRWLSIEEKDRHNVETPHIKS